MQHYLAVCTAISGYISHYTSFATMGSFWYDIMHKVPSHVLALYSKRQSDNSRVNKTFIHWPRWALIKEWWFFFKLHISLLPGSHNWREQTRCRLCHYPLWLLIPSGCLPLFHCFTETALYSPSLPHWEKMSALLAVASTHCKLQPISACFSFLLWD